MSPHESTTIKELTDAVNELTKSVNAMRGDLRVMHTKLFGDPDKETEQGRIPRLEAAIKQHGHKLRRVEPLVIAWRFVYTLAVGVAGALINHFFPFINKGH